MMMSPFARCGTICSMVSSTTLPALIIIIIRRGALRRLHISSMPCVPTICVPFGLVVDELVHLGGGSIEDRHLVAMIVHIEYEVLAHDGEAYQPYVAASAHLRLLIFTDCDSHHAAPASQAWQFNCRRF